jgi:hypothetical protein
MVRKSQIIITAPEAIVYVQLKIPSDIPAGDSLSDVMNEKICLEAQGEAVEISEEYPTPLLMAAFDVVHKVSPEMVLCLRSGKRILLFDHWGVPVLRDKEIYVIDEVGKHEKGAAKFTQELVIDLEAIWKKTNAEENDLEAIKNALQEVEKLLKPSMVTTLIGKAPALLFLLTQHLLYSKTGEIWYQENLTHTAIKIARL